MPKKAIIIGAGPAGLSAAYELLKRTDIIPVILEKSGDIGGISKTVNYKGNRIDIGGHRFFSKSDRVMDWWLSIMPIQPMEEKQFTVTYQQKSRTIKPTGPSSTIDGTEQSDKIMLVRRRISRIYFLRKFFTYPIQLSLDTLKKLGVARTAGILASYICRRLFPRKPEKSLEDFFINRFGNKLYSLFFKDYTEKVWGVPCSQISAEWGAQRIKGISIGKALAHAANSFWHKKKPGDVSQKDTETSLIERFLYPKFGPGQLWEEVARQITEKGGSILFHTEVKNLISKVNQVVGVDAFNTQTQETDSYDGDYFFSTMPVQELIAGMDDVAPASVQEVARGLQYRDFITVGVLLKKMSPPGKRENENKSHILPDTWIYIQEKDVKVGRLQIFNNWSPFMVKDPDTVWVGMEYFCNKADDFWLQPDEAISSLAIKELDKMGLARVSDVLDSTVLRMEKTYPAYFGTYNRFDEVRQFVDGFENLFLVGRNGMHKYNNSDHSMLTAMVAVDNIIAGVTEKANIWEINTEQNYHEEKSTPEDQLQRETQRADLIKQRSTSGIEQVTPDLSFRTFLFENKQNKLYLWLAAIAIIIQFSLFKYWYPFPSFIHGDSFIYLDMARDNKDIDTLPIGYPRFLRLFSVFSNSDTALVTFQYLLIQCSALFLLFTIFYFYKPGKSIQRLLLAFIVLNPLFLHLANLVSSDALFLALSCTWFSLIIWIINRPSTRIIVLHALILSYAFTVRYNALIYPLLSAVAFGLSQLSIRKKILGLCLSVLLCSLFILYTGNRYKQLTGTWQFSPFSGWQMAGNALVAYRFVDSADHNKAPRQFESIDNMIRRFYATSRLPDGVLASSSFYMWARGMPLQRYMQRRFAGDTSADTLRKWASMGPFYTSYSGYLIRTYPIHYLRYFLWPNASNYYAPPVEYLEYYNGGEDYVDKNAQTWFGYRAQKIKSRFEDSRVYILSFYPILTGIVNVLFFCGLLCYLLLSGYRDKSPFPKLMAIAATIWLLNAGFAIFASPAALRFQAFPVILTTVFAVLVIDWMVQQMKAQVKQKMEGVNTPFSKGVNVMY
ncbi:NAD(P)/FAD-dependent oxidoreductase [Puia dinghuensis]|uniref:Protoporphyrinogen oxidase n=1 Tax=Puia dinghuensis TaxID=1792502 RepID=A0A8J2XW71_9BACT|nr:NAD(P)/FAD-dependent oxidoreductase [Puia dinghuensis]GGB24050.1 hypothetical protein GCM10011511_54950 [Puia dinghuensis]